MRPEQFLEPQYDQMLTVTIKKAFKISAPRRGPRKALCCRLFNVLQKQPVMQFSATTSYSQLVLHMWGLTEATETSGGGLITVPMPMLTCCVTPSTWLQQHAGLSSIKLQSMRQYAKGLCRKPGRAPASEQGNAWY